MITSVVVSVVTSLIIHLLVFCAAKPLLTMTTSTIKNWVAYAFFFEGLFDENISQYFNLSGLCKAIFAFAIAFLVMCFIVRIIKVYFSWSNGDPETSPMSVLMGFLKALIVMLVFGVCYEYFVNILYDMYQALINYGFLGGVDVDTILDINSLSDFAWSLIGAVIVFIVAVEIFLIYIGVLTRGLQIMILRLRNCFCSNRFD